MNSKQNRMIIVFSLIVLMCFTLLLNISIMNAKTNRSLDAYQVQSTAVESISSQFILQTPSPTPPAYKNWSLQQALIINNPQGAWLRIEPNSNSSYFVVLQDNTRITVRGIPPTYDGYQYWWLVSTVDAKFTGYVEETSLGPLGKANWKRGQQLIVNNPQNAWLRPEADSNSTVIAIMHNFVKVIVLDGPKSDSLQWWWQVQVSLKGVRYSGWVEQNSLKLPAPVSTTIVRPTAPTIDPTPSIPTLPSVTPTSKVEPPVTHCTRIHPCSH